jgi:ABC-type dipeptide/oligopeptide/nickel transport system permease component
MLSYIIRRLLLILPTLIGSTAVVFFVIALAPGGIGASLLSKEGNLRPEERKILEDYYNKRYGLKKPVYVQYGRWLNQISPVGFEVKDDGSFGRLGFKSPNLGESFYRQRPVSEIILEALPITLLLNFVSVPITYAIAVFVGIQAARHRGKFADVSTGGLFLALSAVPTIWAGVMLIGFFANQQWFKWFPANGLHDVMAESMPFLPHFDPAGAWQRGWLLDTAWHLVLPVVCMSYASFAFLSKLTRSSVLENITADYARTARAKGLPPNVVLYRHVFRNSFIPLITVGAGLLPALVAGSVIIETIFGINGMGKLAIDAVNTRDRELFLADTLIASFLTLIGYLLADIGYALADPRVSFEE